MTNKLKTAKIISFKKMLVIQAKKQKRDTINYDGKNYTIGYDDTLYSNEPEDLLMSGSWDNPE